MWAITPALSSATPRPYKRPCRSVGWNGSLDHCAGSLVGWASWCAYSRTVDASSGAGQLAITAGAPPLTETTSALARTWPARAGSALTLGIRTKDLRSAITERRTRSTAMHRSAMGSSSRLRNAALGFDFLIQRRHGRAAAFPVASHWSATPSDTTSAYLLSMSHRLCWCAAG